MAKPQIITELASKANIADPTFTGLITTAGQIKFPVTQAASSDPNTLDDYEEGTWTATLTGTTTAPTTPITVSGIYRKIGSLVVVSARFDNVDTTGASGFLRVYGLPFVPSVSSFVGSRWQLNTHSSEEVVPYSSESSTSVNFIKANAASAASISAGTGRYLGFTLIYTV